MLLLLMKSSHDSSKLGETQERQHSENTVPKKIESCLRGIFRRDNSI